MNIEKQYLYKVEEFEYIDGAVDGMRALSDMGFLLIIVTNQSGIARGYYTEEDYKRIDEWMRADLLDKGVKISGTYFCPHLPDAVVKEYSTECECRKPKTGLFWQAAKDLEVDMERSFAVGDKLRDLSICAESGVKGILFAGDDDSVAEHGYTICSSWREIVDTIKASEPMQ